MFGFGLTHRLKKIVGKDAVLDRPEDLMLYEYDGGVDRGMPQYVCFPQTTEQVSQIMMRDPLRADFLARAIKRLLGFANTENFCVQGVADTLSAHSLK